MSSEETSRERSELKRCPYCAELIQSAAIVCRYCGRDIAALEPARDSQEVSQPVHQPQRKLLMIGLWLMSIVVGLLLAFGAWRFGMPLLVAHLDPKTQGAVISTVRDGKLLDGTNSIGDYCSIYAIFRHVNTNVLWRAQPTDVTAKRWTVECYAPETTVGASGNSTLAAIVLSFIYSIPENRLYMSDPEFATMVEKMAFNVGAGQNFVDMSTIPPSIQLMYEAP